jgi:protease II
LVLFLSACQSSTKNKDYKGFGEDSLPKEVVQKFAPKPLPPEETRVIENLMDLRSPGRGMLTPNGKKLLFSWSVTGTRQIWKLNGPNRFPLQLTGGEDSTRLLEIAPNGTFAIVSRDNKGNEFPGIFRMDLIGSPLKVIYRQKNVKPRFGFVTKDSRFAYIFANDQHPVNYTLYKININTGKKEQIMNTPGSWYLADADEKRGKLLLANLTGSRSTEISELDLKTKKLTPIIGQGEKELYWVSYTNRNSEYLVSTNKLRDFGSLYRLKGGKLTELLAFNFEIERYQLSENRKYLSLHLNKEGQTEHRLYSFPRMKQIKTPQFKNVLHTYAGQISRNNRYLPISVLYATKPTENYVFDIKTSKLVSWNKSSTPEIDTSKFVVPMLVSYPAKDGTKIPMFIKMPDHCRKSVCPWIINFHGGPEGQSRPYLSASSQYLIEKGFALAWPNVRGSTGYGRKWSDADNGPKRLKVIGDIQDAALFVKKKFSHQGKIPKVGVMGGSYGGYSVMMAMTQFAGSYDAGVAVVGMSSLLSFLQNTAAHRRHLRTSEYGDPEKDLDALKKLSAMNYIDQAKDPVLIIHGVTDPRVPVGEAYQMHQELSKRGVNSDMILFPDEGHGVRKRKNRVLYLGHIAQFFQKHLGSETKKGTAEKAPKTKTMK